MALNLRLWSGEVREVIPDSDPPSLFPQGELLSPCRCDGSVRCTHQPCLIRWISERGSWSCELCYFKYQVLAISTKNPLQVRGIKRVYRLRQAGSRELVSSLASKWVQGAGFILGLKTIPHTTTTTSLCSSFLHLLMGNFGVLQIFQALS